MWVISLALFIGVAWYAFRGSTVVKSMQTSPDVVHSAQYVQPCAPDLTKFECTIQQATTPITHWRTPGRSGLVIFNCSTVWSRWVEKAPAQASDGTTYASLAETRTSSDFNQNWYGDVDATLTAANSACHNVEQGRLHLVWTLLAPAVLLAIASEFVRRGV